MGLEFVEVLLFVFKFVNKVLLFIHPDALDLEKNKRFYQNLNKFKKFASEKKVDVIIIICGESMPIQVRTNVILMSESLPDAI